MKIENINAEKVSFIGSHSAADKLQSGDIRLQANNSPELHFEANGNIYWNGRLLTTDKEIVEGFRTFLTHSFKDSPLIKIINQWYKEHKINCAEDLYQRDLGMACTELVESLFEIMGLVE